MNSHILYRHQQICLIDLPQSIQNAQKSRDCLRSVVANANPFASNEPKGVKREILLSRKTEQARQYDSHVEDMCHEALTIVKQYRQLGSWCHQRRTFDQNECPDGVSGRTSACQRDENILAWPPLILSTQPNIVRMDVDGLVGIVVNPHQKLCHLDISGEMFRVPPESGFLSTTLERGAGSMDNAIKCLLHDVTSCHSHQCFDLIIMDPPWSNRSVRRSRGYNTAENQSVDPFELTLPLIQRYLVADGYVAIWVTNKDTIRSQVVHALAAISFHLSEEWIWLKVTSSGQPVTPLDGVWRKPYEVLLLFTKKEQPTILRRVNIAVPDIHSRKPHMKSLLEELLPPQYRALELFARSLTAGWWSWGDEVLKFQRDSHWYQTDVRS